MFTRYQCSSFLSLPACEPLKQNDKFNHWPLALSNLQWYQRPTAGAQDKCRASCWPLHCVSEPHGESSFLCYARWSCMQAPPQLWGLNGVETLSDCCIRDWKHRREATFSNRKLEVALREKKRREQCLHLVPDNGPVIKITGRAGWPSGAWMNDHYVHKGNRLSLCACV